MSYANRLVAFLVIALSLAASGCSEYMKGNSALRDGQPAEAAAYYRQSLDGVSGSLARARLGLALIWDNKPKEAEPLLRDAVAANPDDWAAMFYLAGAEACQGKSAESAATLDKVRDTFRPYFAAELRGVGGAAMKQGMNCPALAKTLWQVQETAEDNQFRREQRERNSSH